MDIARDIGHFDPLRHVGPVDLWPATLPRTAPPSAPAERAGPSLRDWAPAIMAVLSAVLVAEVLLTNYGFQRTLVAVGGFSLTGGLAGLLLTSALHTHASAGLVLRASMTVACGLGCGVFTGYAILTKPFGQTLARLAFAGTRQMAVSILALVLGGWLLGRMWTSITS